MLIDVDNFLLLYSEVNGRENGNKKTFPPVNSVAAISSKIRMVDCISLEQLLSSDLSAD